MLSVVQKNILKKMVKIFKIIYVGLIAGFVSEGILGAIFSSPFAQSILYNPTLQSPLFIQITPERNFLLSIIGLVILSVIHSWLYFLFVRSIPGNTWKAKGLFWGLTIWLMYWVFQEWFVYHTLLNEPFILNALELAILLLGSLIEGLIIAFAFRKESTVKI